ncbi:unnamed protein product [Auanema sp. JU1783]|nr:unnamed protein product [Auanema sp. JU1783]
MDERGYKHRRTDEEILSDSNFVPSEYIRERLKDSKLGCESRDLKNLRSEMNAISTATQDVLKNSVFENYQQFIDTSKEISHLEREVYQLSSLLMDQKQLIENLIQMNSDDKTSLHTVSSQSAVGGNNPIQLLMQRMDGIAGILNNLRSCDRVILHGEMTLLDAETMQPLHKSMLILLTDRLLIGNMVTSGKYNLESTFSLNSLAAVNVKDRENRISRVDQILKLLIFPEQRYYLCESARVKKLWLDELERAKRELLHEGSLARQATIRGRRKTVQERKKASLSPVLDEKTEDLDDIHDEDELAWLEELPAELDDCIAHRDLEHAVELLLEWKQCKTKNPAVDVQLNSRKKQVIQLLSDDVRRPGAVHGGPRAMKKARTLLTQLGRGTYALDLYLKRRSALQRNACREIAVSEEPLSYVKQLCLLYSSAVDDVIKEFDEHRETYSLVLQWCSGELMVLLSLARRHVVEVAPTIAVLSHTWRILMNTMEDIASKGVELTFEVYRLLGPAMEQALESNFLNTIQGIRSRMNEERWRPLIVESDSALNRLVEELSDVQLNVDWTVASEGKPALNVSAHAIHFSRVVTSLARDFLPFLESPLFPLCERLMKEIWLEYLQHLSSGMSDSTVYAYSTTFILTQVLSLCENTLWGDGSDDLSSILPERFPKLVPYAKDSDEEALDEEEVAHV